ncbi:hypothetical protein APHAL10511_002822 [Amanita phalloides]|nr:hypothetical protein APHAL10511_002822 [Amanita phalloides]
MRPNLHALIVLLIALSTANASWWSLGDEGVGSKNDVDNYASWSPAQLQAWLEEHHVRVPSPSSLTHSDLLALVAENWDAASKWTYDQYESAQQAFADVREDIFDKWDESQLRQFLLRQGVVAAKGPREHLVLLVKERYKSYKDAASSLASRASSAASSATPAVAQATKDAFRALDDSKDYVYSTWSDSQLRSYLEKKGLLKPEEQKNGEHLLSMMRDAYAAVADPIYDAWSDLAMHDWLVAHGVIKADAEKDRDRLRALMNKYYYKIGDSVWSTWSDSQLKEWLVEHGYIKSDAQITRDKMIKIVADNYLAARNTFWDAWTDSDLRDWLVQRGYLRSDAQAERNELIKLANDKYNIYSSRVAAYLTWPDARLRVYLREKGINDEHLPMTRPGLLQETRIRWIQVQNQAEAVFNKIKEIVNEGVYKAEEGIGHVWGILTGTWNETREYAVEKAQEGHTTYESAREGAKEKYEHAKETVGNEYREASRRAEEWEEARVSDAEGAQHQAREKVGETMKHAGERLKGEL